MLKMQLLLAVVVLSADAAMQPKCDSRDHAVNVLLQRRVDEMGVPCEEMCKEVGAYPNCQCPGFAGQPASSDDERACIVKYCQDKACPSEDFVTCVKEVTSVSVLQWDTVFSQVSQSLDAMVHNMRLGKAAVAHHSEAGKCSSQSSAVAVLLQNKVEEMGVPCEEMCKQIGAYPDCQCPGFAGQPASSDDERACIVKYCQDKPCPSEGFLTCVKELTSVSVLQWDTVFSHVSQSLDAMVHNMRLAHKATN